MGFSYHIVGVDGSQFSQWTVEEGNEETCAAKSHEC
jgi:hypothetical protein